MSFDDFPLFNGTLLGKCHKVEALLGEGGFGVVTKCRNLKTGKAVAVKINKDCTNQQVRVEIDIMRQLRCLDPDTCNIVKCKGFFLEKDFTCLIFELLDQSLFDYMEENRNRVLPITELRPIVHQLATALTHLNSKGIVHADLKPENVMVVDRRQQPLKVKLIDFGLALPVSAAKPGICLQTTWYRAPEIMLHIPFNEAIDMWSLGLVAAELATGYPLYPGENEYDMLSYIIETQGQPADHVLERGEFTEFYFQYENNRQHWRFKTPEEFQYETGYCTEETRYIKLTCLDDLKQLMSAGQQSDQLLLVDLIKRMLQLDADQRIKPLEVLQHPFFAHSLPQSSPTNICMEMNTEEGTAEVPQQPPCCPTTGPEIIHDRVESTTVSLAVEENPEEELVEAAAQQDASKVMQFLRRTLLNFQKKNLELTSDNAALKEQMTAKESAWEVEKSKILMALGSERAMRNQAQADLKLIEKEKEEVTNSLSQSRLEMEKELQSVKQLCTQQLYQVSAACQEESRKITETWEKERKSAIDQNNKKDELITKLRTDTKGLEIQIVESEAQLKERELQLIQSEAEYQTKLAALEDQQRSELASKEESIQELQRTSRDMELKLKTKLSQMEDQIRIQTSTTSDLQAGLLSLQELYQKEVNMTSEEMKVKKKDLKRQIKERTEEEKKQKEREKKERKENEKREKEAKTRGLEKGEEGEKEVTSFLSSLFPTFLLSSSPFQPAHPSTPRPHPTAIVVAE